jgi:3'-5' exoribonuclease
MKPQFVRDLKPEEPLNSVFLVSAKDVRRGKNGDPYLLITLCDKTGEIEARVWDSVQETSDLFEVQDFVKIRGAVQLFQTRLQVVIHKLQPVSAEEQDLRDYLPASKRNLDEMWTEWIQNVESIQTPHLRQLMNCFVVDEPLMANLKIAPAAKSVHHAYLGGLLEHTLSMCAIAKLMAQHYRDIDLDLLLVGVMLHDIGKTAELSYSRSFAYSSEGQMLGHIIIAMRWLDEKARQVPDFPQKVLNLLQHMILSHHGTEEFGSPKPPVFLEAVLLNQIDAMDAKCQTVRDVLERDRSQDALWTAFNPALERSLLRKDAYLSPEPPKREKPIPATAEGPKPAASNSSRPAIGTAANTSLADKLQSALKQ